MFLRAALLHKNGRLYPRSFAFITAMLLAGSVAMAKTELGVREDRFLLNGKPAFLYGISYYGALGAPDAFVRQDLADMRRYGFNWIRVWATWNAFGGDISAVDGEGRPREPYLSRLKALVAECDRRGMVVDVTLSRGSGLPTPEAHRRAVETLVAVLKPYRNWYLDLANERNIRDARYVSVDELRQLREAVKRLDPQRLVTASQGGDIGKDELREYLLTARVDFVCPHRPRDAASPAQTEVKTREYRAWMREMGRVVPLHYQEPFRRGYGEWQPQAADYVTDLRGAKAGGAAGWCFHNGSTRGQTGERPRRSFDLREKRLSDQLDDVERRAIEELKRVAVDRPRLP
jgi:hypothetical protein